MTRHTRTISKVFNRGDIFEKGDIFFVFRVEFSNRLAEEQVGLFLIGIGVLESLLEKLFSLV